MYALIARIARFFAVIAVHGFGNMTYNEATELSTNAWDDVV